jgi:hypothetical protein
MIEIYTTFLLLFISAFGIYLKLKHDEEIEAKFNEDFQKRMSLEVQKIQNNANEIVAEIRRRQEYIKSDQQKLNEEINKSLAHITNDLQSGGNINLLQLKKALNDYYDQQHKVDL